MKNSQNTTTGDRGAGSVCGSAEETLRLIARLPAPEGLEERVRGRLRTAPRTGLGTGRILHWPAALSPSSGLAGSWMRGAAAAAIVCVVAGGGWGIYSRVAPAAPAKVVVMPPRVGAGEGFSSAGAMRTPETLNGPVLLHPVTGAAAARPAAKKPVRRGAANQGTANKAKNRPAAALPQ